MFRVSARTVLQLGAELISSDSVAFYELIKNAFDAGSKRVSVHVIERLPYHEVALLRTALQEILHRPADSNEVKKAVTVVREKITNTAIETAPDFDDYVRRVALSESPQALLNLLDEACTIEVADTGEGMTLKELSDIFLTIGTPSRIKTRASRDAIGNSHRPLLGEKGIGRLSVMRLGMGLRVKTTRAGQSHWNLLVVDWRDFTRDLDALIESIPIEPQAGEAKDDLSVQGTKILISNLNSEWSVEKLLGVATRELSKLMDPFTARISFPISVHFNKTRIPIPAFNRILFEHAHAKVTATFSCDENLNPVLRGHVDYRLEKREKTFNLEGANLKSTAGVDSLETLRSLGNFKMEAYWYNRRVLEEITGIGDREQVRDLIRAWSGGLMMFRDGFRVPSYGEPNDDWLDLDRGAFSSQGYKVNRAQLIGKVDISSADNPNLRDQTNREGLRDCSEKAALRALLLHVLEQQLRAFLTDVDKVARKPVTFAELEERVDEEESCLKKTIDQLSEIAQGLPGIDIRPVKNSLKASLQQINRTMADAKLLAEQYDQDRSQVMHLAGLGMMVEHIAHELVRTTDHTLRTLAESLTGNVSTDAKILLGNVEAQLTSLQKRLKQLDPLTTSGRQIKEPVSLVATVGDILRSHEGQFLRHGIHATVSAVPAKSDVSKKMVRGMFIQVIENLMSNSVYWLKQQLEMEPRFKPTISISVHTADLEIRFSDNGPGISRDDREEIFRPFFTRKPPGKGKGLGLYISRQIAEYHGATLDLDDSTDRRTGHFHTFLLCLPKVNK